MARNHHRLVCVAVLWFICGGTMAAERIARAPSGDLADDIGKKMSQDPAGGTGPVAEKLHLEGEFRSAPTLFREGKFAEAERQFAWIAKVRRDSTWGERSQFYLAECQYQQKKYVEALESYERLAFVYPGTAYRSDLVRREFELAQLWLAQAIPDGPAGQKPLPMGMAQIDGRPHLVNTEELALKALEHVLQNDPTGPLADGASIQIADFYMKKHDYGTAASYYDQVVREYLKSRSRPRAQLAAIEARIRSALQDPRVRARLNEASERARQILRALGSI
jgi:TolA-binding protein